MADALLISGSTRAASTSTAILRTVAALAAPEKPVGWLNVSGPAAPSGGADAYGSLAKVMGYVGARVVDAACLRLPLTREAVGTDGLISDPAARAASVEALRALRLAAQDGLTP